MSTDDTTPAARVRLDSIGGLIASLPALLGFVPAQSVVVISTRRENGTNRIGAMARADLPTDPADAEGLAAAVHARIARSGADAVNVVIVAEHDEQGEELPHRTLVAAVAATFAASGIETAHTVWTPRVAAGASWRCYDRCGCTGTVADPSGSAVAAHRAMTGAVTYATRAEAVAALGADVDAASPARRALLNAAHEQGETARRAAVGQAARDDLDQVRDAAAAVGRGEVLPASTVARVVAALTDKAVRDVAIGFALGTDPQVAADDATRLWWTLIRWAPAPEVAEPATLLALASVPRGSAIVFTAALERAQAADPGHQLSWLLMSLIEQDGGPQNVEKVMADGAREAAWALGL